MIRKDLGRLVTVGVVALYLLAAVLFPVYHGEFVRTGSYITTNDEKACFAIAVLAGVLALTPLLRLAWLGGVVLVVIMVGDVGDFPRALASLPSYERVTTSLGWGWFVLFAAAICLVVSGLFAKETRDRSPQSRPAGNASHAREH